MNKIINYIIIVAILFYPFQDLPIPFLYYFYTKPLSIFILVLVAIILLFKGMKIDRTFIFTFISILLISVIDNIKTFLLTGETSLIRSFVEIFAVILSYHTLYNFLQRYNFYAFIKLLIIPSYIIIIFAFVQMFFPKLWYFIYHFIHSGTAYSAENSRLYSTFTEPSWFTSSLLLIAIPLSLSMIISNTFIVSRLIIYFLFCSSFFLILFSTSRIGLLGIIFIIILASLYKLYHYKRKLSILFYLRIIFLLGIIISTLLFIFNLKSVKNQLNTLSNLQTNYSNLSRLETAIVGINIFKNYPYGVGLSNYYLYFESKYIPAVLPITPEINLYLSKNRKANAKNMYSRLLAETGFIGFMLYFGFLIFSYRNAIKASNKDFTKAFIFLSFFSLLFVYLNTDSFFVIEPIILIAIFRIISKRKVRYEKYYVYCF